MWCAHITGDIMGLSQPVPHNYIAVPHELNTEKNAIKGQKIEKGIKFISNAESSII